MTYSVEYAAALEAYRKAFDEFEVERLVFTAAAVADFARFAVAQGEHKASQDAFDIAWEAEAERGEEAVAEDGDEDQFALFN